MRLYTPRWALSVGLAAVATALACYPAWPGFMSYDSLLAYRQGAAGISTVLWPPLHAYLFRASQAAGASSWGVLLFQTFALFLGANVGLNLLTRRPLLGGVLCVGFAAAFVLFPVQAGVLPSHWRDVTMTSFAVLGLGAYLLAYRYDSNVMLVAAALAFAGCVALRYNALPLVAFLLVLMICLPRPAPGPRDRAVAAGAVVAGLALAWASTHWRLPDLRYLPAEHNAAITQHFDLIGISACSDRSYLPLGMTGGVEVSGYQIRKSYDPRHLLLSTAAKPGVPAIGGESPEVIAAAWGSAVRREPSCYVQHRLAVLVELLGLAKAEVFGAVYPVIEPNPFGLQLAHPQAAERLAGYVNRNAAAGWRRPVGLYLLAIGACLASLVTRRAPVRLFSAVVIGALAYAALLAVAAPAADARYMFPANTFLAWVLVASIGRLMDRRGDAEAPPRRLFRRGSHQRLYSFLKTSSNARTG